MVLLYMVLHGSHQHTPFMLALIYQHHGILWVLLYQALFFVPDCAFFLCFDVQKLAAQLLGKPRKRDRTGLLLLSV